MCLSSIENSWVIGGHYEALNLLYGDGFLDDDSVLSCWHERE